MNASMKNAWKGTLAALLCATALGACASQRPLTADRLAHSQESVRAAEDAGAGANPAAAQHLRLAREQIALAEKLNDRNHEKAERMLLRARADAELAQALALADTAKTQADKASDRLRELEPATRQGD